MLRMHRNSYVYIMCGAFAECRSQVCSSVYNTCHSTHASDILFFRKLRKYLQVQDETHCMLLALNAQS